MSTLNIFDSREVLDYLESNLGAVLEANKEAFRLHFLGNVNAPNKIYLQPENPHTADRVIAMPARVESNGEPITGIKWIGSHPENFKQGLPRANGLIILNDPRTNAPKYLLDGTHISAYRTLATTILIIETLGRDSAKKVAILGMGNLGNLHARILPELFPSIDKITTCSKAPNRPGLSDIVTRVGSPAEAVRDADIIVTLTTADQPYLERPMLKDGVLIVNLSLKDCVPELFGAPTTVIVDDLAQSLAAKKIFNVAVDEGILDIKDVPELSSIAYGDVPVPEGLVIVNPLGMAVQDLVLATRICETLGTKHCQSMSIGK